MPAGRSNSIVQPGDTRAGRVAHHVLVPEVGPTVLGRERGGQAGRGTRGPGDDDAPDDGEQQGSEGYQKTARGVHAHSPMYLVSYVTALVPSHHGSCSAGAGGREP